MALSPYAKLGLPERAGPEAARTAFRKLAKTCHPDIAGNDPGMRARFEEISRALKDIEAEHQHQRRARSSSRGSEQPRQRAGHDASHHPVVVLITVEEAVRGALRRIEIGPGRVCVVRIPAGAEAGTFLKVPGLGVSDSEASTMRDVLIRVDIASDALYRVQGADIFMLMEVSPSLLASGGVIELPSPHGPLKVTIEEGTRPGQVLRLRGKGIPSRGERPDGTLYVTLKLGERTRARRTATHGFTRFWPQRKPAA